MAPATTANTQQYGTWRRGFLSDAEIITCLISDINVIENDDRWYIKTLTINRKPAEVNDYDVMAQLGFTAIKATISKDPYENHSINGTTVYRSPAGTS